MMKSKLSLFDRDERAVSPVVGVVLIIGFVVFVGIGLFLFGQGLITGEENPRVDAEFVLEIENTTHIDIVYDTGEEFNSDNTGRLFIIGENKSGDRFSPVTLYDGSNVTEGPGPQPTLQEGTLVLSQERMESEGVANAIGPGSSIQFVWEPAGHEDTQVVVDEMVVPDEATIIQQVKQDGSITFSGSGISIDGGCQPAPNVTCSTP